MKIAIGDVVRVRRETTLRTVQGFTSTALGTAVTLVGDGDTRHVLKRDVELVARGYRPASPAQGVAALVFMLLGAVAAIVAGDHTYRLGAELSLSLFFALATAFTVVSALSHLFLRPRRPRG